MGDPSDDLAGERGDATVDTRWLIVGWGVVLVVLCLAVYLASRPVRLNTYIHFVWQADAWLHGQTAVPFGPGGIEYQDVMPVLDPNGYPTGEGILPFPPLPAVVLLPFVAVFGLATDERLLAIVLGAIDVGIGYWMLGGLRLRHEVRMLTTLFFGLGTGLWYAAATGSTWYWAHLVAVACLLLAVGVALRADRDAATPLAVSLAPPRFRGALMVSSIACALRLDLRQVAAGFLFGLAVTARLTIAFGFPFFMFVGGGGSWLRRSVSAATGAALPIGALLVYTLASTGHLFNPAYDYLYRLEVVAYAYLGYNSAWSIEDLRYVPQNLQIMLGNLPLIRPDTMPLSYQPLCAAGQSRGFLDPACPIAMPDPSGMSLLLTSPAYFLVAGALAPLSRLRIDRATAGAFVAVLAIAFVNLMHFSQGWVQFGYRFSNDFVPFALVLVALGASRLRAMWLFGALVVLSIAINAWGVYWGGTLGW